LGALAATGQKKYQEGFYPLPEGFKVVKFNDMQAVEGAVDELEEPCREALVGADDLGDLAHGGARVVHRVVQVVEDRGKRGDGFVQAHELAQVKGRHGLAS